MRFHVLFAAMAISAVAAVGMSSANEPSCGAAAPACGGESSGCCPKCGCHECMIPVCHQYCEMKKTTKYHYCCKCEAICMPSGHDHCCDCGCDKCGGGCNAGGGCNTGCGGNEGCGCEEEKCNCHIYSAHKLVKIPYTEETPVKKCRVEWICPKCGCNCGCSEGAAVEGTPAVPMAPAPMPAAPPTPGKSAAQQAFSDQAYAAAK